MSGWVHVYDTLYCYTPDEERNKNRDSWFTYYTKPCPYYVFGKGGKADLFLNKMEKAGGSIARKEF